MRNITVASVQFESKPGDKQANLATIRRFVESAARQKARAWPLELRSVARPVCADHEGCDVRAA